QDWANVDGPGQRLSWDAKVAVYDQRGHPSAVLLLPRLVKRRVVVSVIDDEASPVQSFVMLQREAVQERDDGVSHGFGLFALLGRRRGSLAVFRRLVAGEDGLRMRAEEHDV